LAILQPIVNIAEICARHHLKQVVLSPGSRCAPLTIAFVRHPQIQTRSISDERSAAFIALGMAQRIGETVGLVCTSGTAVLNYAPAVAEAFFQQIPLLIFTADRPAEWIAQQDGQTIYQRSIYGRHVKESYELPSDYTHPDAVWHTERIINEALQLTQIAPKGPVHVNVPIREPFYPTADETVVFDHQVRFIERLSEERVLSGTQWAELIQVWENSDKKLIVGGQYPYDLALLNALKPFPARFSTPIVGDLISNLHTLPDAIRHQDVFLSHLAPAEPAALQPDLLITYGQSVLSKHLKLFLRKYRPYQHWHIQADGPVADPFQTLTRIIPLEPLHFFRQLSCHPDFQRLLQLEKMALNTDYYRRWQNQNRKAEHFLGQFFDQQPFNEFSAVNRVLQALPENSLLHLANSMPVRYANLLSLLSGKNIEVYANRGTSGIDGSTSTAVGSALTTDLPVVLITGDVAFFYDRNALWNNHLPANLRIVLLNNHGGNIFRLLDGPSRQPELDDYFETKQTLNASNTAADAGMAYFSCENGKALEEMLPQFICVKDRGAILEITTDGKVNASVFAAYKAVWAGIS
jgi:2-succinyl-5-enolpyruvyl-6-hydroxy-3-cyclohexene-1-carboxylate synthase